MRHGMRRMGVIGLAGVALAGCVQPPPGPSFAALPGDKVTPQQFAAADDRCRYEANAANGFVSPSQGALQSGVGTALVGTALGAAAGALIGSAGAAAGAGAAIGAGTGLIAGSAVGNANAAASGNSLQANYDATYARCMAASGNRIPYPTVVNYPPLYGYPYPYNAYPPYPYAYAAPAAPTLVP